MAKQEEVVGEKPAKRDGPPKYTGRKGAVTSRTIGSESGYKNTHVSRAFRKQLEKIIGRGPSQQEMQAAKARFDLKGEAGRDAWTAHRLVLLGIV